jgi:hypothetical protein
MHRKLKGLEGANILAGTVQIALATLLMSLALWAWLAFSSGRPAWLVAGGGVAIGAGVYGLVIWISGVREARGLARVLVHRIRRGLA